jgi:hypothetical protein
MKSTPRPFTVSADHLGTVGHRIERPHHALEGRQVVPVTSADMPPERGELRFDVAEVADVGHPRVGLDLVVVHDHYDLAQPTERRRAEGLPQLPLLQLAVTGQHENATRTPRQAVGQCHPLGLRDAHAQGSGVGLDIGGFDVRVPGQPVDAPETMHERWGQQAHADQHGVQRGRVVPFRREKDVARLRPLLQVAQLVEEDPAHHLERTEAGADVTGPGTGDHGQRVDARKRRERTGAGDGRARGHSHPLELGHGHVLKVEAFTLVGL